MSDISQGTYGGHMLAHALRKNAGVPVLHIHGETWTGQDLSDAISTYFSAFEELGIGTGSPVALLAANRPEVLVLIGAGQMQGQRRSALHPLGSVDDHAYVLADAGVETLVIDPLPPFVERASALLEKVDSLKTVLTLGPADIGTDLAAPAAAPGQPRAPFRHQRHLHRRHHRQAQGRGRNGSLDGGHVADPARRVG